MNRFRQNMLVVCMLIVPCGCGDRDPAIKPPSTADMTLDLSQGTKNDPPNELGYSRIHSSNGPSHQEGVVDAEGQIIVPLLSNLLINDITGHVALLQVGRKFLFAPLDQGPISAEELATVDGFQYAEPYRCGRALVVVDDAYFYIDADGNRAFDDAFEFAESFHQDRALVKLDHRFQILDTSGKVVSELNYDQVNPQSPWCWQVTQIEGEEYKSGFVDLDGKPITELNFDYVGYYDPEVRRILVRQGALHGFVDERAKIIIPLQYEHAEIFNHGKARVSLQGRSFFIDPNGNEVPE
jgi:hypothetical protein